MSPSRQSETKDNKKIHHNTPFKPTWRNLFFFITRHQAVSLILAIITAVCTVATNASYAIFLGRVMDIITSLGSGTTSKENVLSGISHWCTIAAVAGAATCVFNSAFMAMWVIFGETVARNARKMLFAGLLDKEMAWFDSKEEGISSMLSRMQM